MGAATTPSSSNILPHTTDRRQQLSDDVARYVRELIITNQVDSGDFLRTERIAEAMNISNTPVREGLLRLAGEGFVELVPRRGFVVSAFSHQDIRDLFWTQATLAAELAGRAARNIGSAQLEFLAEIIEQEKAATRAGADHDQMINLGHQFHREINLAANSRRLAVLLQSIVRQLPNQFYSSIEGHSEDTLRDHPKIYAALERRNAEKASELMYAHIMAGADDLIDSLTKRTGTNPS